MNPPPPLYERCVLNQPRTLEVVVGGGITDSAFVIGITNCALDPAALMAVSAEIGARAAVPVGGVEIRLSLVLVCQEHESVGGVIRN